VKEEGIGGVAAKLNQWNEANANAAQVTLASVYDDRLFRTRRGPAAVGDPD
jgi:hypothetical protein